MPKKSQNNKYSDNDNLTTLILKVFMIRLFVMLHFKALSPNSVFCNVHGLHVVHSNALVGLNKYFWPNLLISLDLVTYSFFAYPTTQNNENYNINVLVC